MRNHLRRSGGDREGHRIKLTCGYCCSNLKDGKLIDTFGDKPQGLTLGIQSRSAEGGKERQGLVALSVNTEETQESNIQKTSPDACLY